MLLIRKVTLLDFDTTSTLWVEQVWTILGQEFPDNVCSLRKALIQMQRLFSLHRKRKFLHVDNLTIIRRS